MDARSSDHPGPNPLLWPVGAPRPHRLPRPEGPLHVEIRRAGEMRQIVGAWRRLAENALNPLIGKSFVAYATKPHEPKAAAGLSDEAARAAL